MATGRHLVVVASTDPQETDEMADRLRDAVTVRTAYDTAEVLARLDGEVDVVLVDPALADDAVTTVRDAVVDRDLACLLALLVDDASAADERADAVLSPAVPDATLREGVVRLATEARYRKTLEEYYELARTAARPTDDETDRDRLQTRLNRLARRLQDTAEPLDSTTLFRAALDTDREDDPGDDSD